MESEEVALLTPVVVACLRDFPCFSEFEYVADSRVGNSECSVQFYNLFMHMNAKQLKQNHFEFTATFNYMANGVNSVSKRFSSSVILVRVFTDLYLPCMQFGYCGVATKVITEPDPMYIIETFRSALKDTFKDWNKGMDGHDLKSIESVWGSRANPVETYVESFMKGE